MRTVTLTAKQIAIIFHAGLETGRRTDYGAAQIERARLYAVYDALNSNRDAADYLSLDQIRKELS